ncbi:hypothetical protein V2H45_06120 [Tumidithrix elongata RA019]|uniref:Uncharacterized protein n=1 Tax=Tumidithrix elongata BACA0141 TaxID=2716417 RepID=A0AAW9Q124_9CYAN|nr:hypothetical protein [Tumidithrix elongata RA019]
MKALSLSQLETWMSFYYDNPQPDLIPRAIFTFHKEGYLTNELTQEPIVFFLSFIFRDNPTKIAEWFSQLNDLSILDRQALVRSLWISNNHQSKEYLAYLSQNGDPEIKMLIDRLLSMSPPEIDKIPIDYPNVLDILWASFIATGSEIYVNRIISALCIENSEDFLVNQIIQKAARWLLIANKKYHERVRLCCSQSMEKSEDVALILQEILTEV